MSISSDHLSIPLLRVARRRIVSLAIICIISAPMGFYYAWET